MGDAGAIATEAIERVAQEAGVPVEKVLHPTHARDAPGLPA